MPKLTIDNLTVEVPEGTNVLEAAEKLGIVIPRFCFHPALGSVGACRVCAVKFLEGPVKGVEMSCMTKAKDGMVVSTTHPDATNFRKYVIEWLMLNHPLDCPVCDEGGHCLLQDETVSGGHSIRRYPGPKRTYYDQYLGPFVQHEMNRCIQCWRCRNFYQDFAGYRDLGAMQIGNRTYFGRFSDGVLESPFAGNIIDICPTGVYTDKPSRYKGRRWDFERGPSLCLHCSLGCNTVGSARYREMMRQEARLNETVNGYFICDRGRYGFAYARHPDRPRQARVAGQAVSWQQAVLAAAQGLTEISQKYGPNALTCVGGTRSSLETQGALKLFCRTQGWHDPQFFWDPAIERKVKTAVGRLDERLAVSLRQIEKADFILAAGADPVNEAPMLALALRQAARKSAPILILDPRPVFLPCEFEHLAIPVGNIDAVLGSLIKEALSDDQVTNLPDSARKFYDTLPGEYSGDAKVASHLNALRESFQKSKNPVIVCGTDIVRESTLAIAADLALLLKTVGKEAGLFYLFPGGNAFGAALVSASGQGEASEFQNAQWPWGPAELGEPTEPSRPALSGDQILTGIEQGEIKALVLVENDPFWQCCDEDRLARALDRLDLLIALDYLPSPSVSRAQVVLPTVPLFELTPSIFINQEGRAQLAPPVHMGGTPIAYISPDIHPPRTFLDCVPGSDPRTPGEIFQELTEAVSGYKNRGQVNLWNWLARQNSLFSHISTLAKLPEGLRLLPEAQTSQDFAALVEQPAASPTDNLELLLVDWTFGTEEMSSYSDIIRQAETVPVLLMHPQDAEKSGLSDADQATIHLSGGPLTVRVKLSAAMAPGFLVLPRHRQLNWRKLSETPVYLTRQHLEKVQG